ncbi:MAG: hypothetical protein ACO2PO_06135 [Candidatus Calescibacterium sp.]
MNFRVNGRRLDASENRESKIIIKILSPIFCILSFTLFKSERKKEKALISEALSDIISIFQLAQELFIHAL